MPSRSDNFIDVDNLDQGLRLYEDTTSAPRGTFRVLRNCRVTDRGGISPRLGTVLLGDSESGGATKSLFNFRKSYDKDEFLVKTFDDKVKVWSRNHPELGWFLLKSGFTSGKDFGFMSSLVNRDLEDYMAFCNRFDPYQRWQGSVTKLDGALAGGETTVNVDSTLTDEVFESKTASGSSATTLTISPAAWAASQWVGLYVRITSGVHAGKVRLISATTTTQITFATLGSDPGACTFEIRKLAFPASGTLVIGGTEVAYSAVPTDASFTTSAFSGTAADDSAVTIAPTPYPAAPRGNRLANLLSRAVVGNVRSALARDTGGALSGFASAGSYFVSKLLDAFDFGFSGTRAAGEGDIVSTPYGGGDITDVVTQEDQAYVFKPRYIEAVQYSQDANDLANREPLKSGAGSVGRVIKGADDAFFVTADKKFTSIGRVRAKDITPQTENIGLPVKRLMDALTFTEGRGIEDGDLLYLPAKTADSEQNDVILVWNKEGMRCEGYYEIGTNGLEQFDGRLYACDSTSPDVYLLNEGHADVVGDERYPISFEAASNFMNLTASHAHTQALNCLYFEGYIIPGSEVTFEAWRDTQSGSFLSFTFDGTEESFTDGALLDGFLGDQPLGLKPLGSISEADEDGRVHFQFRVYFPFQYGDHFSVGWKGEFADGDVEVLRYGLGLKESPTLRAARVKTA